MAISDYSTTPASNTAISGIDITGATGRVNNGDNAIRQLMADIKAGTGYLSATSTYLFEATDAGATAGPILDLYRNSASPANADILGKVLFNGEDSGGGTQEYASIETVIVDVTAASEDGQLDFYVTKAGARTKFASMTATATAFTGAAAYSFDAPVTLSTASAGTLLTLTSTDAGASAGPTIELYRDSATPTNPDSVGSLDFYGEDSAGNKQQYAGIVGIITDATSTSEDGSLSLRVSRAGTMTSLVRVGLDAAATTGGEMVGLPSGQLSFPATQNASSDANTLDDYEEGTWTPTMTFNGSTTGVTYTTQTGTYTKIGNRVLADCIVVLTSNGTGVGTALVTAVPFTAAAHAACATYPTAGFSGLTAGIIANFTNGATTIDLRFPTTTGSSSATDTQVTDSAAFRLGGQFGTA